MFTKKLQLNLRATAIAALMFASTNIFAATIDGLWDQVDDKTGRLHSMVKVETVAGKIQATIVKGYPAPGEVVDPNATCKDCPGEFQNKKIVGLRFLWDLQPDGNEWNGGQIIDPDNGKIYNVKAALSDSGNELKVRGYVGISLFGRNQIWRRHAGAEN